MFCWRKLAFVALALAALSVATPAAMAYPYRGGYYRPYHGGYYRPYYGGYGYYGYPVVGVIVVPRPVVVVPAPIVVAQPAYAPGAPPPPPPLNLAPVQPIPPAQLRVAPIPEPNVPPVP